LTPAAIAERRHPFIAITHKVPLLLPSAQKAEMKADPASHTKGELDAAVAKLKELNAKKQMLMYGHVDLPTENYSFKWESGAPQCEDGCAFQDKVFTVEVSARGKDACLHAACTRGQGSRCQVYHPTSLFCLVSRILVLPPHALRWRGPS
jgi:hypothetical protein